MGKLLVIKTGSTLPEILASKGDFEGWVLAGMGVPLQEASVLDVARGAPLPPPGKVRAAVVTGSHAMVTDHLDWSERTAEWLAEAVERGVPLLGICFGHQLLAYALGGEVRDNPNGLEYGTVEVRLDSNARRDALFAGLPDSIRVHTSHVQSATRLPAGAVRLASSGLDPHQAFRAGETAWGVQFHPEFDAQVVRRYIHHNREKLSVEGKEPARLLKESADTPFGQQILRRFSSLIQSRE